MKTPAAEPILEVRNLVKHFTGSGGFLRRPAPPLRAVDDVSFDIRAGEALGLVGESGCGKSTTGRTILRLIEPTSGEIRFRGEEVTGLDFGALRRIRRDMQIVFQDPYGSLDPKMTVRRLIAEPLRIHGIGDAAERRRRVSELLGLVGLTEEHGERHSHEFSGGQRQRIGIARALALEPKLLILDEPVSALDISIQAQILNLLIDLRDRLGIAFLFISHDLAVVRYICDRVAVMYLGKIVEIGERSNIFDRPAHPYTQALLSSVPNPNPAERGESRRIVLRGDQPSAASPPSGCRFRTRCWKATSRCSEEEPPLRLLRDGHSAACHYADI